MIDWRDKTGALCSMVDACAPPANAEEAMALFVNNFNNHYYANRAPFPMFFHSEWFNKYPYTLTGKSNQKCISLGSLNKHKNCVYKNIKSREQTKISSQGNIFGNEYQCMKLKER